MLWNRKCTTKNQAIANRKKQQENADRSQELAEVNHDKEGELTMDSDRRGKGTGVI